MAVKRFYGYRRHGSRLLVVKTEAAIVQRIYADYIAGFSFCKIADKLNEDKIPSPRGKIWRTPVIAKILKDERYLGLDNIPPIIDNTTLDAIKQAKIQRSWNKRAVPTYRRSCFGLHNEKGEYHVIPHEAKIIRQIFIDYLGGHTYFGIAERLNSYGAPSPQGSKWQAAAVMSIIHNEKYAGMNGAPVIVSREVFTLAQAEKGRRIIVNELKGQQTASQG